MADLLSIIWWLATVVGVVAVLVAFVRPAVRRPALLVAAATFAVAGVLGILSIGVLFLVAAIVCGVAAARQTSSDGEGPVTT